MANNKNTVVNTFQSNIKNHTMQNLTDYALFLGGMNVTRDALMQYDPLKTGFGRVFMIRKPLFVDEMMADKMKKFKHVLEYGNIGVAGNNSLTVNFNQMTGGYTNRSMDVPSIVTDDANEFTIKTYEFSGSPMREVLMYWVNGVTDFQSGLSTYNGCEGVEVCQANHTAEFIYVATDQTGKNVEYACLFANCFPKDIKLDQFNYDSGQHELVQLDVVFSAVRYISPQINSMGKKLLLKYNMLMNSLNFHSGYTDANMAKEGHGYAYDVGTGKLRAKTSAEEDRTIINDDWTE